MQRCIQRIRAIVLGVTLLSFTLPHSIHAHNGAVALAYPMEGIIVDGDLGDWPDSLPTYPIAFTEAGGC